MKNRITTLVAALAALAALALGGSAIAGAVSQSGSQPQTVGTGSGQVPTYHGRQGGFGTPLTGDTLAKATAAALAKTGGGTVDRALALPDGTYEVHVIKADKSEVHVHLDTSFAVTGVDQGGPRGFRGMGASGSGDGAAGGVMGF